MTAGQTGWFLQHQLGVTILMSASWGNLQSLTIQPLYGHWWPLTHLSSHRKPFGQALDRAICIRSTTSCPMSLGSCLWVQDSPQKQEPNIWNWLQNLCCLRASSLLFVEYCNGLSTRSPFAFLQTTRLILLFVDVLVCWGLSSGLWGTVLAIEA